MNALHDPLLRWYDARARDLPWRSESATPWGVMVSEFMLQQTPVARVLPVYQTWLASWPTPADLAAAPAGEAVRAWGRLGYPRRALRLHAAATEIVERHGGAVPSSYHELRALPGVGDYTAAAIASFGYGARHAVLDTNARRVLARAVGGRELPPRSVTNAERDRAIELSPDEAPAVWAVAVMELGALVCTTKRPRCDACPIADLCAWRRAGLPAYDGPARPVQTYAGTDRQCRGRLLGMVRDADQVVPKARLDTAWEDVGQRERALAGLLDDGLLVERPGQGYALPE